MKMSYWYRNKWLWGKAVLVMVEEEILLGGSETSVQVVTERTFCVERLEVVVVGTVDAQVVIIDWVVIEGSLAA